MTSDARGVHLYGWDSRTSTWSGPTELSAVRPGSLRLLKELRFTAGKSWFGRVKCPAAGEPQANFMAVIHRLVDCAMSMVYCGDSKVGPAEVLALVPGALRTHLRAEFAFEFVAFASFLGAIAEADAQLVQEHIAAAIEESAAGDSLVFSLCTGLWPSYRDPVLSECIETVSMALDAWLKE